MTCTPSTPAPARKRRRPNQDLQERLARCEELLKEYATAKPEAPRPEPTSTTSLSQDYLKWKPAGKLVVEDDGGVRFMDSILLGTMHDELKAMREIIDEEDNEPEATPELYNTPDDNGDLVMGGETPKTTVDDLQPSPGHIFRLWHLFLERVNPLTKIIHVPTLQPYLVEATSGSQNLPKSVEALLFAIYTVATVSMTADECQSLLGYSREAALQRFSLGVRITLNRIGFLKNYDLVTLQALLIYLVCFRASSSRPPPSPLCRPPCSVLFLADALTLVLQISLQGRYNRHAAWILVGTGIRIAQKMGMHRDGESLGLSPFETEMRRRVWWQLIMLDAKYAMISGLSHSLLPRGWDTQMPRNINDADLFPSGTEPVQDREGPTEMIMVLLTNRIAKFLVETPGIEPMIMMSDARFKGPGAPSQEQIEMYKQVIKELAQNLLELIDRYCDPSAGPLHELAQDMKQEILTKIEAILFPQKEAKASGSGPDEVITPNDNAFKIAVSATEHGIEENRRTKERGFAWFGRIHFQMHLFQYLVGQLRYRTSGDLVEKAWEAVPACYDLYPDLFDVSQKPNYQLATFVLKAWRTRREVLRNRLGYVPDPPEYVARLQGLMPQDDLKSEPSSGSATAGGMMSPPLDKAQMAPEQSMDQLLVADLDAAAIDWDMWGNMVVGGSAVSAFGGFGMGPTTEW